MALRGGAFHRSDGDYRFTVSDAATGWYVGFFNDSREARRFAAAYAEKWEGDTLLLDWKRGSFTTLTAD